VSEDPSVGETIILKEDAAINNLVYSKDYSLSEERLSSIWTVRKIHDYEHFP
jgi:hypothetical protein